jgi:hypothetical protein
MITPVKPACDRRRCREVAFEKPDRKRTVSFAFLTARRPFQSEEQRPRTVSQEFTSFKSADTSCYDPETTMKRRQFFRLPWAVPTLVAGSLSGPLEAATEEVVVRAGADRDGKPFEILGATFQVKVSGKTPRGGASSSIRSDIRSLGLLYTFTPIAMSGFS